MRCDLAELAVSPTAFLFEGHPRAGVDISMFVTRTPPGRAVELHVHPYAETFLLLAGSGRWTVGDEVVELAPEQMVVVPPDTRHGFRNIGDEPLLVVSVHERGTMRADLARRGSRLGHPATPAPPTGSCGGAGRSAMRSRAAATSAGSSPRSRS